MITAQTANHRETDSLKAKAMRSKPRPLLLSTGQYFPAPHCRATATPLFSAFLQDIEQERGGPTGFGLRDFFRSASRDEFPSAAARLGSDINDIISLGDNVEVMFDDDHGAALIDEAMKHLDQLGHIVSMQTDGRFL